MVTKRGMNSSARRYRRADLFNLQNGKCFWCARLLTLECNDPNYGTLDELIPRWMGGTRRLTNTVLSCEPCNRRRGGVRAPKWAFERVAQREEQRVR
jgi:5-methylcytosine-specific restriction endonuclease McrA